MLMTNERRSAIRTLRGWAIAVLNEAGAIWQCEEHGWAQYWADPHARERAIDLARHAPPSGISTDKSWRRSATFSIRSATAARSVRRTKARHFVRRQLACLEAPWCRTPMPLFAAQRGHQPFPFFLPSLVFGLHPLLDRSLFGVEGLRLFFVLPLRRG